MEIFLIKALQFFMSISLLVLLHEMGHFFFAKLFGVRVNKFYLFFNPKFHIASTYDTWVRRLLHKDPVEVPMREYTVTDEKGKTSTVKEKAYVGTEYGLGWLPLGGYCAIDGMIDETNQKLSEETHPWEFRVKPAWKRLFIMVGGVLVNFLLALFIYSMVLYTWGESYVPADKMTYGMEFNEQATRLGFQNGDILLGTEEETFKKFDVDVLRTLCEPHDVRVMRDGVETIIHQTEELSLLDMLKSEPPFARVRIPAKIDSVFPGTPAQKAGLRKGDLMLAINGREVASFQQFTDQLAAIGDRINEMPVDSLALRRVTLVYERDGQRDTIAATLTAELKLGFSPANPYRPTKVEYGFLESIPAGAVYGWNVLASYVTDMKYVFSADGAKSLGGFGTIGSLFPDTWDWQRFWMMTALLSIILAFMNILPIPALDGGHVLFLLYEMITGRKPSDEFMVRAEYVGFGFVIILMILANLNDILRWLGYM